MSLVLAVTSASAQQDPELPSGLDDLAPPDQTDQAEQEGQDSIWDRLPPGLGGFLELRGGSRFVDDPAQSKTLTLGEARLQVAYEKPWDRLTFEFKGDVVADGITEEFDYDQRLFRVSARFGEVDLRIGRQVLTWGTGDQLFINDLFPKDWRSLFVGRDEDYLKAPSDTVRLGWYRQRFNVDFAYTPQFEPDRFIRGERISYWNSGTGQFAGEDLQVNADTPDGWLDDDEFAMRVYGTYGSSELAIYGYRGFWKSPAGQDPVSFQATFPRLAVYGASARWAVGPGIGSIEIGLYDSLDDSDGTDPWVNNSELRLLVGYEQELAQELTGGFQYYIEQILEHDAYREALAIGEPRDRTRHVVTARITRLMRDQRLTLSVFAYLSPSDRDGYLMPRATYRITDRWSIEGGGNLFFGDEDFTFFGQFENNSNVNFAARFSI